MSIKDRAEALLSDLPKDNFLIQVYLEPWRRKRKLTATQAFNIANNYIFQDVNVHLLWNFIAGGIKVCFQHWKWSYFCYQTLNGSIDNSFNKACFGKEAFLVIRIIYKKHWGIKESSLPKLLLHCGPEPADEIVFFNSSLLLSRERENLWAREVIKRNVVINDGI